MNPALKALIESPTLDDRAIDAFIEGNRCPLVDPGSVTFIYRGKADEVLMRSWVHGLPTAQPLERIGEHDFWALELELPAESRIEYKLEIVTGADRRWIIDPLNDQYATDPYGANSVCQAYGYTVPEWSRQHDGVPAGTLDEATFHSKAFGEAREIRMYVPAKFKRTRRYPLLIVHDGNDYVRFSGLTHVLDNLIERHEIPPLIAVLTQSPARLTEYAGDERHARFVAKELMPAMQARLPLIDRPEARGLMGASFGGVAALHTAWTYPRYFDRLLLQSGSFAFSDIGRHQRGPAFDPVVEFMNQFRTRPGMPARRIFMSCGVYESLIYENRSLLPLLQAKGMDVRFTEARDGHNWINWRDRLRGGLTWLFPGPLWMVYD